MNPQIVIPMSGFGERFRAAGYGIPKPLIEIEGKPMIAHVIDLFPGEEDFLFVCNQEHLDDPRFRMREVLGRHCANGRVVGIPPHKLGPVHAVSQAFDHLDPNRPVVVNYCDFSCCWDWEHFKRFVVECKCDGAIPAYRGFHPHCLGTTNYAYVREAGGWILDIREKQPFTDDRLSEYASSGTYYFSSGTLMREAFVAMQARDLSVNGEYYVSLAYKPMFESGKRIAVYELQHFMQWGTPEDLTEYRMWSASFRRLNDPEFAKLPNLGGVTIMPMAGLGERFARAGCSKPKPLIPVSGKPMVVQAAGDLPSSSCYVFVLRAEMHDGLSIQDALRNTFPGCRIVVLAAPTEGQACTALLGWLDDATLASVGGPLTIGACDNGALYNARRLENMINDQETDLTVWVARGYPNAVRQPWMYGWVATEGGRVTGVSVKAPLSNPRSDAIVTGTFTFRSASDFERVVRHMIARDARVNGEYYMDTCIEDALALGLTVRSFELDSYLCWGTPNDVRSFEYWQSCFDKWSGHPYRLERDSRVASNSLSALRQKYAATKPALPQK